MKSNHLLDMLPAYYRDIKEFRELTATQAIEMLLLKASMDGIENDMFISTSSEAAIARREKMFHILADPAVEDLEFRRQRIISRQTISMPFNRQFLATQLEILTGGKDRYTISVNPDTFELNLRTEITTRGGIDEMWHLLERIIPLNMLINTKNEIYTEGTGYFYLAGSSGYAVVVELTNDFKADYGLTGVSNHGSVLTGYTTLELK